MDGCLVIEMVGLLMGVSVSDIVVFLVGEICRGVVGIIGDAIGLFLGLAVGEIRTLLAGNIVGLSLVCMLRIAPYIHHSKV